LGVDKSKLGRPNDGFDGCASPHIFGGSCNKLALLRRGVFDAKLLDNDVFRHSSRASASAQRLSSAAEYSANVRSSQFAARATSGGKASAQRVNFVSGSATSGSSRSHGTLNAKVGCTGCNALRGNRSNPSEVCRLREALSISGGGEKCRRISCKVCRIGGINPLVVKPERLPARKAQNRLVVFVNLDGAARARSEKVGGGSARAEHIHGRSAKHSRGGAKLSQHAGAGKLRLLDKRGVRTEKRRLRRFRLRLDFGQADAARLLGRCGLGLLPGQVRKSGH
jgi:hypothetical protein